MTVTTDSTPQPLSHWLARYYACSEAREWAESYPDTAEGRQRAWAECPRGDWMLWIAGKLSGPVGSPARRLLVRGAVACARTVLDKIPEGEARSEIAAVLDALDAPLSRGAGARAGEHASESEHATINDLEVLPRRPTGA